MLDLSKPWRTMGEIRDNVHARDHCLFTGYREAIHQMLRLTGTPPDSLNPQNILLKLSTTKRAMQVQN